MSAILIKEKKKGAVIVLSEASHASHSYFTWCTSFVINQSSKGDNNIMGHFSFIYFFINVTFVMCNRSQASCPCKKPV